MAPLKANIVISFILLLVLLIFSGEAVSQRRGRRMLPPPGEQRDSLQRSDTLMNDSLANDTLGVAPKKKEGLDAPVSYEANDSLVFTQDGYAHLYGDGKVNYPHENIELTAAVITMNMDSSTVYAHGVEDSLGVMQGTPVFKDGETPYETNTIRYNFKSKRVLSAMLLVSKVRGM